MLSGLWWHSIHIKCHGLSIVSYVMWGTHMDVDMLIVYVTARVTSTAILFSCLTFK
jgi:hypothetical protein